MKFPDFFQKAMGNNRSPYDFQKRLACGEKRGQTEDAWLNGGDSGAVCQSQLVNIPTGLGKTAAVVLAWLWNRVRLQNPKWPRRLVYCLPMRTLVEQTEKEVRRWILRLARQHTKPRDGSDLRWLALHAPIILMGGEDDGEWDIHPEKPAILIGTQDMLLSRALNRGYGMSRYRWPMHFGLLNNDCLWVMDETQLMGVGVETSAQLDGFRHLAQWANAGNCPTWWMSATLDETRLATVDHPRPADGWNKIILSDAERSAAGVRERYEAKKPVTKASFTLNADTKKSYATQLAKFIAEKHEPDTLTLVVVNRVERAREIYAALKKLKSAPVNSDHVALIHSRFRPTDRERHTKLLFGEGDRIVIATQAVEAGVDVSARLLITELAPWSSLVQRFGRCNREGKLNDKAEIVWIDIPTKDEQDDLFLPYSADDLKQAADTISALKDAGAQSLSDIRVQDKPVIRPVLRRRDLVDLFDTTPDLCGQDLDISRFVRDGENSDVQFFWRTIPEKAEPTAEAKPPVREELCRVSIGEAAKFLKKNKDRAWQWNALDEKWRKADHARPGAVYLVAVDAGGYHDESGWTGDSKDTPSPHPSVNGELESYRQDPQTFARYWLSYDEHIQGVVNAMTVLAKSLSLDSATAAIFHTAAQWHDAGKVHDEFQKMLRGDDPVRFGTLWAKSANKNGKCQRRGFRHELASALVWFAATPTDVPDRDLIAYLIAAHHGKVRLSIRALPDEKGNPANPDGLFARGIWHEDKLPAIPGLTDKPVTLDLGLMQMGEGKSGPSWLARMIGLRDHLGPFRLAYLETLLRAADMRTSCEEAKRFAKTGNQCPDPISL